MKNRTFYGALAVALTASITLSGCSGSSDKKDAGLEKQDSGSAAKMVSTNKQDRANLEQGGSFTSFFDSLPVDWNAWNGDGNNVDNRSVSSAVDPNFYDVAPDGTVTNNPDYLESMPKVEDKGGKQVATYTVNPKAKFNDGTPIDYRAFEATRKAMSSTMQKGGYNTVSTAGYEDVEKVEKGAKDNEVVVTFKKKYNPISEIFGGVMHPSVGNDPKVFNTGFKNNQTHNEWRANAFIIDKVDATGKTATLVPNPKWWGQKPLLDKIIFREMEDSATIPAFKNGELDMVRTQNKARYQQIQGANQLDIRRGQLTSTRELIFNGKDPSLKDVNLRKAIWQSIDREQYRKIAFDGLNWSEPAAGSNLFYSFQKEYEDNFPVKYSKEDAQKTLTDAGYTKGADGIFAKGGQKATVKITYFGDDPTRVALARTLQSMIKAAGIDAQLDQRASGAFNDAMVKKDYGIVSMAYQSGSSSPLVSVCQFMCSDNENNLSFSGTPELDARIKKVGEIADHAAQAKEINAIEKDWFKATYGMMPLYNGPQIEAYRKGIANIGPSLFQSLNPHWENVGWQKGMKKG
ncbi:ABC transporter family substrate-binding protein [Arsenicicoccus dermatophilus]|uniref:ABC transporter family substrate-binding protein n=1 Tax=Arsenicicoccus dermatophilus TaxID=1076331 RepID=UPI00391751E6